MDDRQQDSSGSKGGAKGGPQVGTRFSAQEIHENILHEADEELQRPIVELAISGLASGLSIGFSFLATALAASRTAPEYHAIAAFGFRHSIAGAVEAFYRVWMGDAGLATMLGSFELPALAGNIIGGVVLVALVNHGQAGSKPGSSNAKKESERR